MQGVIDREIIETIRDGLLVLDRDLTVVDANKSFYSAFKVSPAETIGRKLYDLGDGQWDIPDLRRLLEEIIPKHASVAAYQVSHDFPSVGKRVMLLNARKLVQPGTNVEFFLLAIDDITERRKLEDERERLSQRVEQASAEATHRIKNSFQLLLAFINLQSRQASESATNQALDAISSRVHAIARLYEALSQQAELGASLPVAPYVTAICKDIHATVINDARIALECHSDDFVLDADRVVTIGLAINELVTNSVKHAFTGTPSGKVHVAVKREPGAVLVTVSDNGHGLDAAARSDSGLGQMFLKSFVTKLNGTIDVKSSDQGTVVRVSVPLAAP